MRLSKIILDSIHVSKTYGGSLEGIPPKTYIVDSAKRNLSKMYGDHRPTHIVVPEGDTLPAYQYVGWFTSWTPVKDEDACGSHLFLIWWDDKQTLDGVIDFAAANWEHAKDFDI